MRFKFRGNNIRVLPRLVNTGRLLNQTRLRDREGDMKVIRTWGNSRRGARISESLSNKTERKPRTRTRERIRQWPVGPS